MVSSPFSLYFHIPFCTKKCPYCHFYVISNQNKQKKELLKAFFLEWETLKPSLLDKEIVSIYLGGGTPSLWGSDPIQSLLKKIRSESRVAKDCEITLEANPENVTLSLMKEFYFAGINRVSIGVQSLTDESLQTLGRTHSAQKAIEAIILTAQAGIYNISIDLMFELPDQTLSSFQKTLDLLPSLPITHLSLYNLTIEPETPFAKRKLNLPSPEVNLEMLESALETLHRIGLQRYEISAFAKPGFHSRHNIGYWTGRSFFGLGPSAFSYFEGKRYRNIPSLPAYIESLEKGISPIDFMEELPHPKNVQEKLAVQLRLSEGVNTSYFSLPFETLQTLARLVEEGYLLQEKTQYRLSSKGLLFYDTVASELI